MSFTTRSYKDGDDATQAQHVVLRSSGDCVAVTQMGDELTFAGSPNALDNVTQPAVSAAISVVKRETVVLKIETEKSGPTFNVRLWWQDSSGGGWTPSAKIRVVNTGRQDSADLPTIKSNFYHAETMTFPTHGAANVKVEIVNNPNGDVSIWAVGR